MSIYTQLKRLNNIRREVIRKGYVALGKVRHYQSDLSLWDLESNAAGHMIFGGCDVVVLAEQYGTPLHIVDQTKVMDNYQRFSGALERTGLTCRIYTSYKTNPVPAVLDTLHGLGAGAEVISPFELHLALHLGMDPSHVIYNGVNKSDESLKLAAEVPIKCINVNSFKEIQDINGIATELGKPVDVGIRVCPKLGIKGQFGFLMETGEAMQALKAVQESGCLRLGMVHMHLGLGVKNIAVYAGAWRELLGFLAQARKETGCEIRCVDIGGGHGIDTVYYVPPRKGRLHRLYGWPYRGIRERSAPSFDVIAETLARTFREECSRLSLQVPEVILEPGRILMSNTQMLVGRIGDIRANRLGSSVALADVGLSLATPLGWEYHEMVIANKAGRKQTDFYAIAGPTCNPADILTWGKRLPRLEAGDYLAILDSGAYFTAFTYNFSFPRPAIVMVNRGRHRCVRRHETFEDMMCLDLLECRSLAGETLGRAGQ